ncbi:MAG: hypothetical protein QOD81_471 [Solirubrobacteraceae bacterium]|jgi:hypothetical protein|nr:hypothetical protein [Solirubrobacteraceae bacterium]
MAQVWRTVDRRGPEFDTPGWDRAVADLATRQYGVVSRPQLRALGLTDRAIARRLGAGRLHRIHRGVYAVGHPVLSRHGRWLAAVLACGPGAALSHTSAGALWQVRRSAATKIDVTVASLNGRARPGLRIHRSRSLPANETTLHDGIPVTTLARTLLDLAAGLPRRQLERALEQAEILRLLDAASIDAICRVHPNHRGTTKLRAALAGYDPAGALTKSDLEKRMLALCRAHALPPPLVNSIAAGLEVDFLFPDQRLVVETDGWAYHRTRAAFERDRRRDATLARAGHRVLRFTDRQVEREPQTVAETIAAALATIAS